MAKMTFGKFQGWETDDLARAGEIGLRYLRWGSEELKSPFWRKEFERACKEYKASDARLMAKAMMVGDSDLTYDEALILAKDELAQDAEIEEMLAGVEVKQKAVVTKYLSQIPGKTEAQLRMIGKRYEFSEGLEQIPDSQFSSKQAKEIFLAFMKEWEDSYE